ncbi:hypothetical protein LG293_16125 (plasmid) [Citricoccus nitrophenolicus]
MTSIWPEALTQGLEVPARTLGHTLVLEDRHATGKPTVVHAAPRPAGYSTPDLRLRDALAARGKLIGSRYRKDGLETALANTPCRPNPPYAVDVEPSIGRLNIWGSTFDTEVMVVQFISESYYKEPDYGWGLELVIDDFTHAAPEAPGTQTHPKAWTTTDRDRWLTWAGFAPLAAGP